MIQYLMKKIIGLAATAVCIGAISSCAVSGNDPFEKNGTLTEKDNVFGKDIPEEELLPKMNINVDETLALIPVVEGTGRGENEKALSVCR